MKSIVFLLVFLAFSGKSLGQSLDESVLKAIRLSEAGKNSEALALLDEAIETFGDQPMLRLLKGEVHSGNERRLTSNQDMYNAALEEFNKAIALDSTFSPAYNSRALLNIFHQYFELAVMDLTAVIRLTRDDIEAQFNAYSDRGSCKSYLKDYQGAIDDYNAALALREGTPETYGNMGIFYAKMDKPSQAVELFLKGLEQDSLNVGIMNNLAMTYIWNNRVKDAIALLRRGLELDPNDPLIYNNLGLALIKSRKPLEAVTYINKSIEIYPENAFAYKHLGMAKLALKQKDEACAAWEKALQLGYSRTYDNEVEEFLRKNCRKRK
jgi:tetratricopeptide (TPR) repeat protein